MEACLHEGAIRYVTGFCIGRPLLRRGADGEWVAFMVVLRRYSHARFRLGQRAVKRARYFESPPSGRREITVILFTERPGSRGIATRGTKHVTLCCRRNDDRIDWRDHTNMRHRQISIEYR